MKYFKYIVGTIAAVSFLSCSNFLDEKPDQRTVIDTPEKAKDLLVYAYPSSNSFLMMEIMSDNADDSGRTQNTTTQGNEFYRWENETSEDIDSPAEFWESSYKAIAHANQAIESINILKASQSEKDAILGEAYLSRAYNHWMLAILFCEAYDPATADSKLGIPYVESPEKNLIETYQRGTLQNVYTKIEGDIERGLKLVTNDYRRPTFHFTIDAGKAFAARFYANTGDWNKVMQVTNSLGDYPEGRLRDYTQLVGLADDAQGQKYGSPDMATNLLLSGVNSIINRQIKRERFGATRAVLLPRIGRDFNPFNMGYVYDPTGYVGFDIFAYKKFYEYFVYSNQSAGIGQPYVNVPLLTYDEMYLFRIEATIMGGDFDKAAKMIGYFAKFRTTGYAAGNNENTVKVQTLLNKVADASEYQPFYNLDNTQRKLVKFLAEMRRSEFMHLGNRWYDIKRFNLPVQHKVVGEGVLTLQAKDVRKAVQLPQSALSAQLTPNPR